MMTFDETGSAYTYDSDGNLISASDNAQRNEAYNFNNANELTQFTNENNETYKYFYNQSDMPHRLTAARSQQRGNGFVYTYTAPGVPLQTLMGTVKETVPWITPSRICPPPSCIM